MHRPRRITIVIGLIATGVLVLAMGGLAVFQEVAVTRWPALVIRWSPSPDHVMRAMYTLAASNPAGTDAESIRGAVDRFTTARLEALIGPELRATRTAMRGLEAIGMKAVQAGAFPPDPDACESVRRFTVDPRWWVRAGWLTYVGSFDDPELLLLPLIGDPHPVVAALAGQACARSPTGSISSVVVDRLVACLDYRAGPDPADRMVSWDALGVAGMTGTWTSTAALPPPRSLTPAELAEWEGFTRRSAWRTLAAWSPVVAESQARERWPTLADTERASILRDVASARSCPATLLMDHLHESDPQAELAFELLLGFAIRGRQPARPIDPNVWALLATFTRTPFGADLWQRQARRHLGYAAADVATGLGLLGEEDRQRLGEAFAPAAADASPIGAGSASRP